MKIYSARRGAVGDEDLVDVSVGTTDPIGRALILSPTSSVEIGLLGRYTEGRAGPIDISVLELYTASRLMGIGMTDVQRVSGPAAVALASIARFARRVVISCDCVSHEYSSCLRTMIAQEVARRCRADYLGDLVRRPSGRVVATPSASVVSTLRRDEWMHLLRFVAQDLPLEFLRRFHHEVPLSHPPPAVAPRVAGRPALPPFCTTLGLDAWPVSVETLRAAWRTTALRTHPDREGGSSRAFKAAQAAYQEAQRAMGGHAAH